MKRLRLWLMIMAAPATVLLGLHLFDGTPISKNFDTGFTWRHDDHNTGLVLSANPGGSILCWIRLRIPVTSSMISADASTGAHLRVTKESIEQGYQWIDITKDTSTPEEMFDWPSGAKLNIGFQGPGSDLRIGDWEIHLSSKADDSHRSAQLRHAVFIVSLFLYLLALTGVTLEAVEKNRTKRAPFSPQYCLQLMIDGIEGENDKESESIRTILGKVLLEGANVEEALAPLGLKPLQGKLLWLKAAGRFRAKLRFLIEQLIEFEERSR